MDVIQKCRGRLRRSSCNDIRKICIPALSSPDGLQRLEVRRYSAIDSSKLKAEQSGKRGSISVEPLGSLKGEDIKIVEGISADFLEENKNQKAEIGMLKTKLKNSLEKISEQEEMIKKLHLIIDGVKQERLQDEEVRYQRSILAKRQYTLNLETEIKKMNIEIQKANSIADKKVQMAKVKIAKVKQDCALKIFEIREENSTLVEQLAALKREFPSTMVSESKDVVNQPSSRQDSKHNSELILQLSEQISILDEENLRLKRELRNLKKSSRHNNQATT